MPIVTALDGRTYEISAEILEKSQIPDDALTDLDPLPEAPPVVPGPPAQMPPGVQVVGGNGSQYVQVKPGPNNGVIIEVNANPQPAQSDQS